MVYVVLGSHVLCSPRTPALAILARAFASADDAIQGIVAARWLTHDGVEGHGAADQR
jgi:hypothetical protein